MKLLKHGEQVVIAIDQLVNALLFGFCDETLSARAYRMRFYGHWWKAYKFINALFFWQSNHCKTAYESETNRRHLPPEYRIF